MIDGPLFCPINGGAQCCKKLCMLWVEWSDGGECAFHAIAVQLNTSDEVICQEGEEDESEQLTIEHE